LVYHFAFLDIDNFKPINDQWGHDYGDDVLRCVTHAYTEVLSETGFFIRMGGDEFALLFTGDDPVGLLSSGLSAVHRRLRPPSGSQGENISISIGMVSIAPADGAAEDVIYHAADKALYEAKERKGGIAGDINLVRHALPGGGKAGIALSGDSAVAPIY
jgi:diguanylate cyclase (GGDEF)-like protein